MTDSNDIKNAFEHLYKKLPADSSERDYERYARDLCKQKENPARVVFGFGHGIASTASTLVAVAAPFVVTGHAWLGFFSGVVAACALIGAAARNDDSRKKDHSGTDFDFAYAVAKKSEMPANPVATAFLDGMKNGTMKNGLVYVGYAAAGAAVIIGGIVKECAEELIKRGKLVDAAFQGKPLPDISSKNECENFEPYLPWLSYRNSEFATPKIVRQLVKTRKAPMITPKA